MHGHRILVCVCARVCVHMHVCHGRGLYLDVVSGRSVEFVVVSSTKDMRSTFIQDGLSIRAIIVDILQGLWLKFPS